MAVTVAAEREAEVKEVAETVVAEREAEERAEGLAAEEREAGERAEVQTSLSLARLGVILVISCVKAPTHSSHS